MSELNVHCSYTLRALHRGLTLALTLALALGLISCPDTRIPELKSASGRVCSIDELEAFRDSSNLNERDDLWIAFVDVGQGDAIWIRTPGTRDLDARDIIIDSGNCLISNGDCGFPSQIDDSYDSDGVGALIQFMVENGWIRGNAIDYLIVTHPDQDHSGGTWKLLQEYEVRTFISSGFPGDTKTYLTALDAVSAEPNLVDRTPVSVLGLSREEIGQLRTESWGRNVTVNLVSADLNMSDSNNSSIVLMLEYLGVRVLLTGDAQEPLDERLVELDERVGGELLRAQVLKAGHHGGYGTNTQALLDRVFPESGRHFAVISSGLRDGLPHPETVARLEAHLGAQSIYRTDRGDSYPERSTADSAGDDHVLLRVTPDGDFTICYAYPDQ